MTTQECSPWRLHRHDQDWLGWELCVQFTILVSDSSGNGEPEQSARDRPPGPWGNTCSLMIDFIPDNIDFIRHPLDRFHKMFMDDDPKIRKDILHIKGSDIRHNGLVQALLRKNCCRKCLSNFGFRHTARLIVLCVGSILTPYDGVEQSEDADLSKAYDKNETKLLSKKVIGHALKLLPLCQIINQKTIPENAGIHCQDWITFKDLVNMIISWTAWGCRNRKTYRDLVQSSISDWGMRIDETEKYVLKLVSHSL